MLREILFGAMVGYVSGNSNYGLQSQTIPRIVINIPPSGISDFSVEPRLHNPAITDFLQQIDAKHKKEHDEKAIYDLSRMLGQHTQFLRNL
jgi:hypothetical protein